MPESTAESQQTSPHFLLEGYTSPPGAYDELLGPDGTVRPHCRTFYSSLEALGPTEFNRRWAQAQHLLRENGIAYGAYGDPHDRSRPWELDALPLLIPEAEWQQVAAALDQRARLLNLLLADLYGPQELLKQGLLPAEVLFSHAGFLRPCHGQFVPQNCFLTMYAADLARSPDGRWWVLADRTEAPSGLGYTLENRVVISRMLPGTYQQCHVQRLAGYFIALQSTLRDFATRHRDNPRMVLLSQGPQSPNFFEDAYLARYLGYTLAEGADLAVRNKRVLLKTLGGLLPVDIILRRPNSADCDPLELEPHSPLGVAGLSQAAREGHVVVVNALGSGLVESPVFMAFLPKLSVALLGEPLQLPGIATWWCGDEGSLAHVLEHLDQLIVKRAFRQRGREYEFSQQLSQMSTDQLRERIVANPGAFVAQEKVARSAAPVWTRESTAQGSHVAVRTFLVRSADGYWVMPGGLTRISSSTDSLELSVLAGERSKDTWIMADGPVSPVSLLNRPGASIKLRRSGAELPSRVADNLFWLGRHLERAEAAARLLRTISTRLTGEPEAEGAAELPVLLHSLAEQGQIEPGFVVEGIRDQLPAIEQALPDATLDGSQPGSLRSIVTRMYRVASLVRDRMSIDSWRIVNRIDQQLDLPRFRQANLTDVVSMTNNVIVDLAAFSGLAMESMTRTLGWRFLDLGRRLERALQTTSLMQSSFRDVADALGPVLEAVLEVADSLMTYRSRYLANLQMAAVLDLLLTDESNPRSVAYQLVSIANHIQNLPREQTQPVYAPEQRYAMSLLHTVRMTDVLVLAELHGLGEHEHLQNILSRLAGELPKLCEAISHRYLIHAGLPRQLSEIRPELTSP